MILHFQMTLPLLREANEAPGFFLLVLGLGLQSLQKFLEARKTISWSCFLFCTDLGKEGRRGGSKANKARQGKAGSL